MMDQKREREKLYRKSSRSRLRKGRPLTQVLQTFPRPPLPLSTATLTRDQQPITLTIRRASDDGSSEDTFEDIESYSGISSFSSSFGNPNPAPSLRGPTPTLRGAFAAPPRPQSAFDMPTRPVATPAITETLASPVEGSSDRRRTILQAPAIAHIPIVPSPERHPSPAARPQRNTLQPLTSKQPSTAEIERVKSLFSSWNAFPGPSPQGFPRRRSQIFSQEISPKQLRFPTPDGEGPEPDIQVEEAISPPLTSEDSLEHGIKDRESLRVMSVMLEAAKMSGAWAQLIAALEYQERTGNKRVFDTGLSSLPTRRRSTEISPTWSVSSSSEFGNVLDSRSSHESSIEGMFSSPNPITAPLMIDMQRQKVDNGSTREIEDPKLKWRKSSPTLGKDNEIIESSVMDVAGRVELGQAV